MPEKERRGAKQGEAYATRQDPAMESWLELNLFFTYKYWTN